MYVYIYIYVIIYVIPARGSSIDALSNSYWTLLNSYLNPFRSGRVGR